MSVCNSVLSITVLISLHMRGKVDEKESQHLPAARVLD